MMIVVLLRLAYLSVSNLFAILRLLPVSDRDKDVEILALRHRSRCHANRRHLLHALRDFEQFSTTTGRTRASATPAHCIPCRSRSPNRSRSLALTYNDANDSAASSTNINMPLELGG
jgi:hypothetical protein